MTIYDLVKPCRIVIVGLEVASQHPLNGRWMQRKKEKKENYRHLQKMCYHLRVEYLQCFLPSFSTSEAKKGRARPNVFARKNPQ
jgi:hypothetical protein